MVPENSAFGLTMGAFKLAERPMKSLVYMGNEVFSKMFKDRCCESREDGSDSGSA